MLKETSTNNHNFLLKNSGIRFSTWLANVPALTVQKDDCAGPELSGERRGRLWKEQDDSLSGNLDITQTAWCAHDWLKEPANKAIRLGGI